MASFLKEKSLNYLGKDFTGLKRNLIKFSQAHHSGVFSDYNETSPGMMLLEQAAYIGDVLSFYLDQQFSELKQETARQIVNVNALAKQKGYKSLGKRASRGKVALMLEIPSITDSTGSTVPDPNYLPKVLKGAKCAGPNGIIFETLEDIDYSLSSGREVTGSQFNQSTGQPSHFAVRKFVDTISGETKTDTFTITDFEQFKKVELSNTDVLEIISVTDSDGNEWYEVDYLAQEAVFDQVTNTDTDNDVVQYNLKYVTVPRRFITERDVSTNVTSLRFGSGDGVNFDDDLIPNLADIALPLAGRRTFSAFELDPQNFLKTRTLGLSPFNTTLTVKYRVGGGKNTLVPPGTIDKVVEATFDFPSTSLVAQTKSNIEGSIECINVESTEGGEDQESIRDINANSSAFFAAQGRAVTREDFMVRVQSMPERFGSVSKVYVKRNLSNPLATDIHVLTKDSDGKLQNASSNLKKNIKTFLRPFRMLNDTINILDTNIINLRCNFGIVVSSKFNRSEVITKCIDAIREKFDVDKMQIGNPLIISDFICDLQSVIGVISVYNLTFSNVVGTVDGNDYSNIRFDVRANTDNGIIYIPENSIFEIKFPRKDIVGVAK